MISHGSSICLIILSIALSGCSSKKAMGGEGQDRGPSSVSSSKGAGSQEGIDKSGKGGAQSNDVVKISTEDQRRVGIQVQPVVVQQVPRALSVAGQVQMDEQQTSHLGTIADGRITAVNVLPGALVRRGQVLGDLHSHMVHETVGPLAQAYA